MPELRSLDYDRIIPHLIVLDTCASWGLLTYEKEEVVDDNGYKYELITVHHKQPICQTLTDIIEGMIKEKGEHNW
jgi:hypothetical protein